MYIDGKYIIYKQAEKRASAELFWHVSQRVQVNFISIKNLKLVHEIQRS
jgi:hypothetical protein